MKREISEDVQCAFLGFAGGVMVAASVWSLLIPGIERAEQLQQINWLVASGGFMLGVLLLLQIDRFLKKRLLQREVFACEALTNGTEELPDGGGKERTSGLAASKRASSAGRSTILMILAITVHNIPEGMAVGLAFALACQNPSDVSLFSGALALTLGIGIQNYPEGTAVALPLRKAGMSRSKSFLLGSLSAVVEPIAGVTAAVLAESVLGMMPVLLALAAGTMIYVVVQELIPEAHLGEQEHIGTLGFVVGFVIMMILDVALG